MAKLRVGVLLSGCGVYDGAEVHESVITLLALDRAGAEIVCMAPSADQLHVIDHRTGDVAPERRNVLVEAARIARGAIADVDEVDASALDALVIPGGFGAAKNLCDFALKGPDCTVHPGVARVVRAVHAARKPVGAICIAPTLVARLLGTETPTVTIGNDAATAAAIEKMGARHRNCAVDGTVVDAEHLLVTTPAYMLAKSIAEAASGIEKLVGEVLSMAARS
ncbi:MAG: isoprenoid biosynthesis glyoxalase ElbB [Acidobacteriota bacterium]